MTWIKRELSHVLSERIRETLKAAVEAGDLPVPDPGGRGDVLDQAVHFVIEEPADPEHGDFASNVALQNAGVFQRSPREIAEALVRHFPNQPLDLSGRPGLPPSFPDQVPVEMIDIAGPGFVNVRLGRQWLGAVVASILEAGGDYGKSQAGRGQSLVFEFVSANPTGPMNVVNARQAAVGDTLCRLHSWAGYRVIAEYYINDAGNQFRNLARSLEARVRQQLGEDAPLPENGYPGDYMIPIARQFLRQRLPSATRELLARPEEERLHQFGVFAVEQMVKQHHDTLERFRVVYNRWQGERALRTAGEPEQVVRSLKERGFTYEQDGAVWFRSTDFGDDKDRVLIKQDGSYTYLVPDIAYHLSKAQRGDHLVDLLGPDHHGYIQRMKAALKAFGYDGDMLEVLIIQQVNMLKDGKRVKMSKRQGNFISMDALIDEVGVDAARFFFLMRAPESHMDFDLDRARLQTNENPVYYVQYAHARISSMLRKAQRSETGDGGLVPGVDDADLSNQFLADHLTTAAEQDLIRHLGSFPAVVVEAAEGREPQKVTAYARDLAASFHTFYTECRVLGVDQDLSRARLALVKASQQVLQNALQVLGVSAPDKM